MFVTYRRNPFIDKPLLNFCKATYGSDYFTFTKKEAEAIVIILLYFVIILLYCHNLAKLL